MLRPFRFRGVGMLERLFGLRAEGVTAKSEIVTGVTVFFTMAYILFVNPQKLWTPTQLPPKAGA